MAWTQGAVSAATGLQELELGVPLRGVARYALFTGFLAASLMFYVWSRVDAKATSAELDLAVRTLQSAQVESKRLELEIASRRNLAGLEAKSLAEGWTTAPKVLVSVGLRP